MMVVMMVAVMVMIMVVAMIMVPLVHRQLPALSSHGCLRRHNHHWARPKEHWNHHMVGMSVEGFME